MALSRGALLTVGFLAAAILLLESTLLRLLAIAQNYHFAFLVISLALLGIGASGSALSMRRPSKGESPLATLRRSSLGFSGSVVLAYVAVNLVPFDSYSIAWDRRQILFFGLYYLALALPFFFGGLGIGASLAAASGGSHLVYAANLAGSGLGALLAPAALGIAGVPGAVLASGLTAIAGAMFTGGPRLRRTGAVFLLAGIGFFAYLGFLNLQGSALLGMTLSPYKGLSNAMRYPGASLEHSRWNAISRLDLVAGAGTRQLPGLSYTYKGVLPEQLGISVDGNALHAVTLVGPDAFPAGDHLPEALAFRLHPRAEVLVIEPGGGMGVLQALAGGEGPITVVESNPLLSSTVSRAAGSLDPYAEPRLQLVHAPPRAYLRASGTRFDLIAFPLTDAYLPVSSGAFSLRETYELTVESFQAALARLGPDGILVATRWLQTPPSEGLRLVATLTEALERGGHPAQQSLVAYRGVQTFTVLVRPGGWPAEDLDQARAFLVERKFDLVWAPDISPEEVNRFNRYPSPDHYLAVRDLLQAGDRSQYTAGYPFDIRPVIDDRPFFFHFFRWEQTPEVLATLGMTWQPFGGSGYLLLFALLALVLLLSALLILLPVFAARDGQARVPVVSGAGQISILLYFACLGIAFLFVEIPLIQRGILVFGHASYAFVAVVPVLLLFSGLGSLAARHRLLPRRMVFALLVGAVFAAAFWFPAWMEAAMGWPAATRIPLTLLFLAPLGFLMGLPFPWGLQWLGESAPGLIAWAWAVNGCASVISAVLAAILSLSYGFTTVIVLGGLAYGGALVVYWQRAPGPINFRRE